MQRTETQHKCDLPCVTWTLAWYIFGYSFWWVLRSESYYLCRLGSNLTQHGFVSLSLIHPMVFNLFWRSCHQSRSLRKHVALVWIRVKYRAKVQLKPHPEQTSLRRFPIVDIWGKYKIAVFLKTIRSDFNAMCIRCNGYLTELLVLSLLLLYPM